MKITFKKVLTLSVAFAFCGTIVFSGILSADEPVKKNSVPTKTEIKKSGNTDWDPDWDDETKETSGKKAVDSLGKKASDGKKSETVSSTKITESKNADKMPVDSSKKTTPLPKTAGKPTAPKPSSNASGTAQTSVPFCPVESVIAGKSIAVLKIASLNDLNAKGKDILNEMKISSYAPLDWLKFTPFAKAVDNMIPNKPIAVSIIPNGNELGHVIYLPVKNYSAFASALGAKNAHQAAQEEWGVLPANTCVNISLPDGYFICGYCGYALLFSKNLRNAVGKFYDRGTLAESRKSRPSVLKGAVLSFESYPDGIRQIKQIRQNGLAGFSLDINKWAESLNDPNYQTGKIKVNKDLENRWNDLLDRTEKNLRYFQIDLDIQDKTLLTAITGTPADETPMMAQIEDRTIADVPLYFTSDKFTKIVPEYSAPVTGQIDLSSTAAASLQSPFNQIRHVEYSLILPGEKNFLAENWCIFLEVSDAKTFVRELVVPKAQYIGGYTGAEMGGELAARVFGNIAVRRQNRGMAANPAEAAAAGNSFGARLGERIGQMMGEKEATAVYDFEGFPLYIADMEFYVRKMEEIKAKESGQHAPKAVWLNGERTLINTVLEVLSGRENELTSLMNRSSYQNDNNSAPESGSPASPNLIAKKNFFLVLDDHHLLIVPGNRDLLREAKNNWLKLIDEMKKENVRPTLKSAQTEPQDWSVLWDLINGEIVNASRQQIRSITRLDPPSIKYLGSYLNTYYLKGAPLKLDSIPDDTPEALLFTTTSDRSFHAYYVAPLKTIASLVQVIKEVNNAKIKNEGKK